MASRRIWTAVVAAAVAVGCVVVAVCLLRGGAEEPQSSRDQGTGRSPTPKTRAEEPPPVPSTAGSQPQVPANYVPPPTHDAAVGRFVDRRQPKGRVTPDITSRMPRLANPEDVAAVVSVLRDAADDDTVRNEAANLLRRSDYNRLTDELVDVLDNPKEGARFRSFAVQHLWQNATNAGEEEKSRIVTRLREALDDRHVAVRREALLALARLGDEEGKRRTIAWLGNESGGELRDAAIRCAKELDLRDQIPTIREHLRDEDEVVRIAAIVALSQWADRESRLAFEEATRSGSARLQRAGKAALKRLDEGRQGQ